MLRPYLDLSVGFLQLKFEHTALCFPRREIDVSLLQCGLLHIGSFVKNAEFIISLYQLQTCRHGMGTRNRRMVKNSKLRGSV